MNKYDVQYGNVLGISVDSAPYMNKCIRLLKTLVNPDLIHIQCWDHKLDKITQIFSTKFQRLNECISKCKKLFKNTRKRKHNYFKFLESKYKESKKKTPKLFPLPVLTRWGSWKISSDYLELYIEDVVEYAKSLPDDVKSVKYFKALTPEDVLIIAAEATFVREHGTCVYETLRLFEGSKYPLAHKLYPKLKKLLNTFSIMKKFKRYQPNY